MKLHKLVLSCLICMMATGLQAENILPEARIYINPGHGGWGPNDRPMATINYAVSDTLGFFETNTNLWKAQALQEELQKAGTGYIRMSRTANGFVAEGDKYRTENDSIETDEQMVTLSIISEDVETNNMDYFISIHSNATTDDATTSNYPLLLYRGTDDAIGNGLVEAKNMCSDAWKYIFPNDITYRSYYGLTKPNVRGDITFQNGKSGSSTIGDITYIGYYGVLRHGCDGYLTEGCFHTYQPERQRLMNKDYCRQEGVRYSRAIRAWFGDASETKGSIMGTVKDISGPLEHALYTYQINSIDAYAPLNNAEVILYDKNGVELKRYTTDSEHNGVYVFTGLEPGMYELGFNINGYWEESAELKVTANETAFINQRLTPTSMEKPKPNVNPEVEDFEHPVQDGDIAGAGQYNFTKTGETAIEALDGLTVRRAILRNGQYYILAHDAEKAPKLLVVNPEDGSLIKEMETSTLETEGYNGKKMAYVLSDIAFTRDNVLIGVNSVVVGKSGNGYQTGNFYVYKWQGTEDTALEDAQPEIIASLPTNDDASIAPAGNNNSNFVGNSIGVSGTIKSFKLYFDSHPGNNWTTNYDVRYVCWQFEKGVKIGHHYNNTGVSVLNGLGEDSQINLSPTALDRFILDSHYTAPFELEMNWLNNDKQQTGAFTADIDQASKGSNFFRYARRLYMSAPVIAKQADDSYSYLLHLYDITDGLSKAVKVGETTADLTGETAVGNMAGSAVVDNEHIDLYLLAGNKVIRYSTKNTEQPLSPARIFAYNLKAEYTEEVGYTLSFDLNEDAEAVDVILTNANNGTQARAISLGSLSKGANQTEIAIADLPEGTKYNWSIRAKAGNVTRFTKLSGEGNQWQYSAPKSVAINNNPDNDYFGRIYISNTDDVEKAGKTGRGIYMLDVNDSPLNATALLGGLAWTGSKGQNFRKVAVAEDGRVFIADASLTESGVYIMDPATQSMSPYFVGTRDTEGKITNGGAYIGGRTTSLGLRGTDAELQLYLVDITHPNGNSWTRRIILHDIGESTTCDKAVAVPKLPSSYIGNENNSIVPVSTGYWAGQYRGAGSGNSAGTPSMFYYSDQHANAAFNSASFTDTDGQARSFDQSSQNGGLAVYEKDGLVALSYEGGVHVFQYTLDSKGIPEVNPKFHSTLSTTGATYDDFAFDYAGNLYAVSYTAGIVSKWAMPTTDNTSTTPAKKSMFLTREGNLPAVGNLEAAVDFNQVTLTWETPEDRGTPVGHYEVYRNDSWMNNTTALTYTDTDMDNGTYTYKVIVVYEDGSQGADATIEAIISKSAGKVQDLTANVAGNNVELTWSAPEGITATATYNVYRGEARIATNLTETRYTDSGLTESIYNYSVTAVYGDYETEKEFVTATITSGLTNNQVISAVYPNPVQDQLTIESATLIREIHVLDLSGRLMYSQTGLNTQKETIQLSGLKAGTYMLRVNEATVKIMKR